jgi:hypothetical protein
VSWPALTLNSLKPWLPKNFTSSHSELVTAQDSALRHVERTLEKLSSGGTEKRPIHDIVNGTRTKIKVSITTASTTPIPLFSHSGLPADSVSHLTLGTEEAFCDGNAWDCGSEIKLLNGKTLHNRCFVKGLASQIKPSRVFVSGPGRGINT